MVLTCVFKRLIKWGRCCCNRSITAAGSASTNCPVTSNIKLSRFRELSAALSSILLCLQLFLLTTVLCTHKRPQHCINIIRSNHTKDLCFTCMETCGFQEVLLHDMLLQHLGQGLLDDCARTTTQAPPCKRAAHARWTLRRSGAGSSSL